MPMITLRFHACRIGEEGIATDDDGDYFVGSVDLDVVIDGKVQSGLVARVKQAAGSDFADPLEVQLPAGLRARLPYRGFRDCVEDYVRRQVGSHLVGERDAHDLRIHDVTLPGESTCTAQQS